MKGSRKRVGAKKNSGAASVDAEMTRIDVTKVRLKAAIRYVVVYVPQYKESGRGEMGAGLDAVLSQTPKAAMARFLDRYADQGLTWAKAKKAGWRVRKVRVSDLGEPE